MRAMMTNQTQKQSKPADDDWQSLYARIRQLAYQRSVALLATEDEPDSFDRGARSLRTLMSAAEIARRMKFEEQKEQDAHDPAQDTAISDDAIRRVKRRIDRQIARIEREDRTDPGRSDGRAVSKDVGKGLGGKRP